MGSKDYIPTNQIEFLAKSLAELLEPLTGADLEKATIEAICKHRVLVRKAEDAYVAWDRSNDRSDDQDELYKAYKNAILNNRAQMAVVVALTDKLGYIPDIPASPPDLHLEG